MKRQANILSSIITNFDTVEDVLETSANSAGSAMAENAKYLDSIDGKTQKLTNSMETLWMHALNSDFIKFLLDVANGVVKITDKVGLLNVALSAFLAKATFKSSTMFGSFFAGSMGNMSLNTKSLGGKALGGLGSWLSGLFGSGAKQGVDDLSGSVNNLNTELATTGTTAKSNVIQFRTLSGAQTANAGAAKGAAAANTTNTSAIKAEGAAAAGTTVAVSLLNAALTFGISLAIGALISWVMDLANASEKLAQKVDDVTSAYETASQKIRSAQSTIKDISKDYETLSKGVDAFGNNVSLSTSQYERYNEIVNQIAEMFPEMVTGYTEEGNAIIKNKGNVEELTKAYQTLQDTANSTVLSNASDIMKNYYNQTDKIQLNSQRSRMDDIDVLHSWLNGSFDDWADFTGVSTYADLLRAAGVEVSRFMYLEKDAKRLVEENKASIQAYMQSLQSQVNAAVSQVKPIVGAYLDTSLGYAGLTPEQKNMVDAVVADFDAEFFNQFDGDETKMYAAIEGIISKIKDAGIDEDFSLTLDAQTQFNNNELSYDQYMEQINKFISVIEALQAQGLLDEEVVISLKALFDIDENGQNKYETMLNSAKELLNDEGDAKVGDVLKKSDLEIVDKYKEEWMGLYGAEIPLEKLKSLIIDVKKTTGDFSVSNIVDEIDTIQGAFGKLGDAYDSFKDNGVVTAGDLADIVETFGDIEGIDKFIAILGDSTSSMAEVKNALSEMATAYLSNRGVLNSLTEENEKFVISQLKAFGVTNAEEYIKDIRSVQQAFYEQYQIDLSNFATVEQMKKFILSDLYDDAMAIEDDKIKELSDKYKVDLTNFKNKEQQKILIAIAAAKAAALADKKAAESKVVKPVSSPFGTQLPGQGTNLGLPGLDPLEPLNSRLEANANKQLAEINKTYNDKIKELEDIEKQYKSLDEYVAKYNPSLGIDASKLGGTSSSGSSSSNETLDWVAIRLEEINEQIDLMDAKLENAVGHAAKNNIIDSIIGVNKTKAVSLISGIEKYAEYAATLLAKIPSQYRQAAQDGSIAISEFAGEANSATVEAINNYREWAQKVADLNKQLEETKTTIAELAQQKFETVAESYDNPISLLQSENEQFESQISLMEESGYVASEEYYKRMIANSTNMKSQFEAKRKALQDTLNQQVADGNVEVNSTIWYGMVQDIYDVDKAILDCENDIEGYNNSINDIKWDNFDQLISNIDALSEETQSLIRLMENSGPLVDDNGEWTKEGLASLGLYAQQMEIAEYEAQQYADAIQDLKDNQDKYSESEYADKLEELVSAQYDSIEAYYDAQDAIVDLNKTRVDAIKQGIDKEIEAYEELINKKKEALDADKDIHDFQKSVMEQEKEIATIERKLAAIANDNSMAANAKRAQLQAELAEANAQLEETYYDRSVNNQKDALDKQLDDFKEEKDKEKEQWDEYLKDIQQVIADSLGVVANNASGIYTTLSEKASQYGLTLSDAILTPWKDGSSAIGTYQGAFDTAASSTMTKLEAMKASWQGVIDKMVEASKIKVDQQVSNNQNATSATKKQEESPKSSGSSQDNKTDDKKSESYETYVIQNGDTLSKIAKKKLGSASRWKEIYDLNKDIIKNPNKIYPKQKIKLPKYATGTLGTKNSQLAWIDELGEELVMHASGNGKLAFLSKGSAVVPHDITKNLMELGKLDPSDVLSRNTPQIGVHPEIHNTEISVTMDIAEVVHIDSVTQDTIPDLTKAVKKQIDEYVKQMNRDIRKYTR